MEQNIARTIYENIKVLCKYSNVLMSDLEKEVGKSAGYFSRVAASTNRDIGIVILDKAADALGVTLVELLDADVIRKKKIEMLKEELAVLESIDCQSM